jgi:two-component system, NarL family, invasion response regulator UvrY
LVALEWRLLLVLSAIPSEDLLGTATVLIVDDHATFRSTLRDWLAELLPEVATADASSGEECLALVKELCPRIVLMDIGLPGISGLEATKLVLAARPATKVVIVSIHDTELLRAAAAGVGAVAYITKSDMASKLRPLLEPLLAAPPATSVGGSTLW